MIFQSSKSSNYWTQDEKKNPSWYLRMWWQWNSGAGRGEPGRSRRGHCRTRWRRLKSNAKNTKASAQDRTKLQWGVPGVHIELDGGHDDGGQLQLGQGRDSYVKLCWFCQILVNWILCKFNDNSWFRDSLFFGYPKVDFKYLRKTWQGCQYLKKSVD